MFDDIIEIKADHSNESNSLASFLVQTTTNTDSELNQVNNPIDADLFSVAEITNSNLDDKTYIIATNNTSRSVDITPPTLEQIGKSGPPLLPNFILGPIKETEQLNAKVSSL